MIMSALVGVALGSVQEITQTTGLVLDPRVREARPFLGTQKHRPGWGLRKSPTVMVSKMSPPKGWPSVSFRTRLMAHAREGQYGRTTIYSARESSAIHEAGRPSGPLWETGEES